jgi:hypothetical protein
MKTQQAIKLAGSAKALADLLGITQSAISQWPKDLPETRVWQLWVLRPNWFSEAPVMRPKERRTKARRKNKGRRSGDK